MVRIRGMAVGIVAFVAAAGLAPPARAVFPGANGRIVFSTTVFTDQEEADPRPGDVWRASSGRRVVRLVDYGVEPTVSPNGRRLAYTSPASGIVVALSRSLLALVGGSVHARLGS